MQTINPKITFSLIDKFYYDVNKDKFDHPNMIIICTDQIKYIHNGRYVDNTDMMNFLKDDTNIGANVKIILDLKCLQQVTNALNLNKNQLVFLKEQESYYSIIIKKYIEDTLENPIKNSVISSAVVGGLSHFFSGYTEAVATKHQTFGTLKENMTIEDRTKINSLPTQYSAVVYAMLISAFVGPIVFYAVGKMLDFKINKSQHQTINGMPITSEIGTNIINNLSLINTEIQQQHANDVINLSVNNLKNNTTPNHTVNIPTIVQHNNKFQQKSSCVIL